MKIKNITDDEITEFFLNDPALCYLGLPDVDMYNLYEHKIYRRHNNSIYKGVFNGEKLICVFLYEQFTELSLNVHFYISTKLQKQGMATKMKNVIASFFKKAHPFIKKIIITVPKPCSHVTQIVEHFEFKQEGLLTNCIKWRNKLTDLIFYAKELDNI